MRISLIVALVAILFARSANATPGATAGAFVFGVGAAVGCDHLVRSYMEDTPESDEPWYLVWYHVGTEDVAGFAAGTACAIPAGAFGTMVGLAVEVTVIGASATIGASCKVSPPAPTSASWSRISGWDGNLERPTFNPSIWLHDRKGWHGFIREGDLVDA